ncbi:deoxyribonuclease IV [Kribbella sp. NPDC026611]|uniref:deoxyribonuclease IV n=1 Tax=Kribbella sp. NPDC026611 TaxID=3154911 RepID=UPI0033EED3EA
MAVAGGLIKGGLGEAVAVGAEVIQFFAGNPRSWIPRNFDPAADDAFHAALDDLGLEAYVHAPHLINLGSSAPLVVERSFAALTAALRHASRLGATGVVFHAGSSVVPDRRRAALAQLHELMPRLLDTGPPGVRLLVEPTAGGAAALASTIESTVEYLDAVADDRLGLCLDTCHLHAAGEDLSTPGAVQQWVKILGDSVGLHRLHLIHMNDSRDPPGAKRDRHESLGKGTLGTAGLAALLSLPELRGVSFLAETPTHAEDVAMLRSWRRDAENVSTAPASDETFDVEVGDDEQRIATAE